MTQSSIGEVLLADPNIPGAVVRLNTAIADIGRFVGDTYTKSLTSVTSPWVIPYSAVDTGDKTALRAVLYDFTGTLTGAFEVQFPNSKHMIFVRNSTSGGFNITAKVSGQTGVVVRPGETRQAHVDGTDVKDIVVGNQNVSDTFSARPAAGKRGRVFYPEDAHGLGYDDGVDYDLSFGPVFPLTKPPTSGWSWVNQGSATITQEKNGEVLRSATAAGVNIRARVRSVTAPYTITAMLLPSMIVKGWHSAGLLFRESGTGELHVFDLLAGGADLIMRSVKYDSPTVLNATPTYQAISAWVPFSPIFLRIADDNTDRICSFSMDGQNFVEFHKVGRTDFLTANQVGFHISSESDGSPHLDMVANLLHWRQT